MSTIQDITSLDEWKKHTSSLPASTLLIISFHAPWAAPCAQMAVVLKTLAAEYPVTEPLSTSWVAVNAEDLSDLSEQYDVTAVPFLVLSRGGKVLETVSGSSAAKVRTAIETHASPSPAAAAANGGGAGGGATATTAAETGREGEEEKEEQDPAKQKEELFKRLGDLVKAAPVMLFMKGTPSKPECGFSRQLVAILRENAVKYGFFNILADDEVRQGLKEFADWPTYPQLWMNGDLVGGLDIVSAVPISPRSIFHVVDTNRRLFVSLLIRSKRRCPTTPISSRSLVSSRPMAMRRLRHHDRSGSLERTNKKKS